MFIALTLAQYFTTLNTRNEEETKKKLFFSTFFKRSSFFMAIQPGRKQESKLTSNSAYSEFGTDHLLILIPQLNNKL